MTTATRVTVSRQSPAPHVGPANQLDVILMPWGTEADVSDDGRTTYRERWEPGSLVADDPVPVYGSHVHTRNGLERGPLIGVARDITDTPAGLRATLQLGTDEGRRIHELAALGVRAAVSIEADAADPVPDASGVVVRTADMPAMLTGVATILPPQAPAYAGALVTAVRAAPSSTMSLEEARRIVAEADGETPEDPEEEEPEDEEEEVTAPDTTTDTTGRAGIAEAVRTELARYNLRTTARPAAHPLQRFDTLKEAMQAGYKDIDIARELGRVMVGRALADQVTTDPNTGVVKAGWINQIYGIVDQGRPVVAALGGAAALPPDGMTINWPTFAGDLTTLVGVQATQKTTITSVKVSIGNANAPLKTFAGGSDISLQLINRSSPSYLEAYLRIMAAAYAAVTDKDAATALSAQVTLARNNFVIYDPAAADATGSGLRTAVFTASVKVQKATGAPGSVILAGETAFIALGGKLTPAPVFNATGTADASTLSVDVSGLKVVYDPYIAATEIIVTNAIAAQWREEGPQTINDLDVERLGQNYAVWGLGLLTPTTPTGIVGLRTVAPTFEEAQQSFDDGYLTEAPEKPAKK